MRASACRAQWAPAWRAAARRGTTHNWYEAKVVVDTDAGSQRLRFWVDTDADGDYSDETTLLSTNTVDDDWDAGYVGLYRREPGSDTQQFDDVKIGVDNNGDGDILDAGDDVQIDDDFGSNAMSLSYDNNGNLTDDGIFKFVYDAWNRLRKVTRRVDAQTTVAEYEYDGTNRRTQKVVTNSGPEVVASDGGNTTVHFYYSHQWQILETRDGSNQTTRQWVWGLGGVGVSPAYIDELILMDVNGDATIGNDVNPDETATGEGSESPADKRYFYHQDRNWNVIALSEYVPSGGSGVNGRIVERYTYTPYGEFVVLKGDSGAGELGSAALTSPAGNIFFHQGLLLDQEKQSYQNRWRDYATTIDRFRQQDPVSREARSYVYIQSNPNAWRDPLGLAADRSSLAIEVPWLDCDWAALGRCLVSRCLPIVRTTFPMCATACGACFELPHPLNPTCWTCAGCGAAIATCIASCFAENCGDSVPPPPLTCPFAYLDGSDTTCMPRAGCVYNCPNGTQIHSGCTVVPPKDCIPCGHGRRCGCAASVQISQ